MGLGIVFMPRAITRSVVPTTIRKSRPRLDLRLPHLLISPHPDFSSATRFSRRISGMFTASMSSGSAFSLSTSISRCLKPAGIEGFSGNASWVGGFAFLPLALFFSAWRFWAWIFWTLMREGSPWGTVVSVGAMTLGFRTRCFVSGFSNSTGSVPFHNAEHHPCEDYRHEHDDEQCEGHHLPVVAKHEEKAPHGEGGDPHQSEERRVGKE